MPTLEDECRRLRLWNRIWLAVVVFGTVAWIGGAVVRQELDRINPIEAWWEGDRLHLTSFRGYRAVTYLVSESGGVPVAARLPQPLFILDSAGKTLERATWANLEWRIDGGTREPPPAVGARITPLYQQMEAGEFRDRG